MSLTQGLAALGALTGITGATLGVLAFVRDRARLVLRGQLSQAASVEEAEPYLFMYVINAGRQPIAIVSAGITVFPTGVLSLIARLVLRRFLVRGLLPESGVALSTTNDPPLVMQPGELSRFVARGTGYEYGKTAPQHREVKMGALRLPSSRRSWASYLYAVDGLGRVRVEKLELPGIAQEWRIVREGT